MIQKIHATTVLGMTVGGSTVMGADGQVTVGETILKHNARKVRRLYNDRVLAGFAGAVADALTLFGKFEDYLQKNSGQLERAAVELTKEWRTDKYLRQLNALLVVIDKSTGLIIAGTGEIVEPDDGILAIGSGASYALAAARVLKKHTALSAREIVEESLKTAAGICVYTNDHIVLEEL